MTEAMDSSEEQFFEQGERPSLEAEPESPLEHETPQVSARRTRLRRVVAAALLASVALLALGVIRRASAPRLQAASSKVERRVTLAALQASPLAAPLSSASSTALEPSAVAPSHDDPPFDSAALIRSARRLLEAGRTRDGVALARAAVNANPKNAEPYILLAAGLQDLGRWDEARTVFANCKQATSSGPNATCRYFAGL